MSKKEAIDALKISAPVMAVTQEEFNDYIQTLNKIIDWLDQEPCKDAISRQAVLEYIKGSDADLGHDSENEFVCQDIKELPPVAPRTGHWKKMVRVYDMIEDKYKMIPYTHADGELNNTPLYVCDCGHNSNKPTNYCPDCGAKMESEE